MIHGLVQGHGQLLSSSDRGSAGASEEEPERVSLCVAIWRPRAVWRLLWLQRHLTTNTVSDSESDLDQSSWSPATHSPSAGLRFSFLSSPADLDSSCGLRADFLLVPFPLHGLSLCIHDRKLLPVLTPWASLSPPSQPSSHCPLSEDQTSSSCRFLPPYLSSFLKFLPFLCI